MGETCGGLGLSLDPSDGFFRAESTSKEVREKRKSIPNERDTLERPYGSEHMTPDDF